MHSVDSCAAALPTTMPSLAGLLPMLLLCHAPLLRGTVDRVCPVPPTDNDSSSAPSWLLGSVGRSVPAQQLRTWVWAVRHGEAEHNLDPVRGWKIPDPALTARGWRQASAAAEHLPCELSRSPSLTVLSRVLQWYAAVAV